jgi:hypothetical protein
MLFIEACNACSGERIQKTQSHVSVIFKNTHPNTPEAIRNGGFNNLLSEIMIIGRG